MNESQDQVWWIENICDSETDEVDRTDSAARLTSAGLFSLCLFVFCLKGLMSQKSLFLPKF